jgi:short-subunit dehydrogenase involved in D-alanine esterification of teichoic acids
MNSTLELEFTTIQDTVAPFDCFVHTIPSHSDMESRVWLITGCSSGFGQVSLGSAPHKVGTVCLTMNREQFVRQNIARGDKVIATGRNAATKLAHLIDTGAVILDLDVTIPEADIFSKIQEAHQIYGRIDVLVNNAGYIESGAMEELSCVSSMPMAIVEVTGSNSE